MLPYVIVLISTCYLLVVVRHAYHYQQKWVAYLCTVVITVFAMLRGYVGTDTYSYHVMFFDYGSESLLSNMQSIEPLFAILIKFSALMSGNSFVFTGLISVVQGLVLIRLIRTSDKPAIFLAIYIAVFYLNFEFNILRAGTAILLLMLASRAKSDNNGKLFYLFGIASVLTHYTAIIGFFPMVFMKEKGATAKILATVLMLTCVAAIFYLLLNSPQNYKIMFYSHNFFTGEFLTFGIGFIVIQLIYLLIYISAVNKNNVVPLTAFFLVWLIMVWATIPFEFVGRIADLVNALLLFSVIEHKFVGWRSQALNIGLLALICVSLSGNFKGVLNDAMISAKGANLSINYLMSPYNPYKFFWEDQ